MSKLTVLLRSRQFRELLVVALLSALVWIAGPFVAIAGYSPLESSAARLVGILLLTAAWAMLVQIRVFRAERASESIAQGLTAQADSSASEARAGGHDAAQLQRRFEDATAELRKSNRAGLYDLPWYVIIGPPGAGKTTALANSGLDFPLAGKFGPEALRGVGGTRNCDWWFTDKAVLIDTAGRFTTQDSDATADREGWRAFLGLLKKTRPRQPINGVLVALSASDLMTMTEEQRSAQVRAVRDRLWELQDELELGFPVYLLITKSDLLNGFTEFFDDLDKEGRSQVLGFTLDLAESQSGVSRSRIGQEIDALLSRLSERVVNRLETERDARRRAAIFGFCEQVAGLRSRIASSAEAMVSSDETRIRRVWLRGIYLMSGTQQGTPIDRMLGVLANAFQFEGPASADGARSGRAYFVERLLREVVLKEAALAGLNPKAVVRRRMVQTAGYASAAIGVVASGAVLTMSYNTNLKYLGDVESSLGPLVETTTTDSGLDASLARLDAIALARDAATMGGKKTPWSMRWGLSTVPTMSNAVRDAYALEVSSSVVPEVVRHLERSLSALGADPDRLYDYLRIYLMLSEADRLEAESAAVVVRAALLEGRADAHRSEQIAQHFETFIREPDAQIAIKPDLKLVESARSSLRNASPARLVYRRYLLTFPADHPGSIRLDQQLGLGSERVFSRASGRLLSEPLSAVFSKAAFDDFAIAGRATLVKAFLSDRWILGESAPPLSESGRLLAEVSTLYERDYIRHWDDILADVQVRAPEGSDGSAELLRLLGSPSSPLKALIALVDRETNLTKPEETADPEAGMAAAADSAFAMLPGADSSSGPKPGETVTEHFASIRALVSGSPAPIDRVLQRLSEAASATSQAGGGGPLDGLGSGAVEVLKILKSEAEMLPAPVKEVVVAAADAAMSDATGAAGAQLSNLYRSEVLADCRALISGRYPFETGSQIDAPLADVGRILGSGGVFERFFSQRLANFVDPVPNGGYQWRDTAEGVSGGISLARFASADRARRALFENGASTPSFRFNLSPDTLDAGATRFLLELDGQAFEYRHGPPRSATLQWPGQGPGQAAISFEMTGGSRPNRVFSGPWAFFRLLDSATIVPLGGVRYRVAFSAEGAEVTLVLEALSSFNPLGDTSWRRFTCQ